MKRIYFSAYKKFVVNPGENVSHVWLNNMLYKNTGFDNQYSPTQIEPYLRLCVHVHLRTYQMI